MARALIDLKVPFAILPTAEAASTRVIVASELPSASTALGEGPVTQEGFTLRAKPTSWLTPSAVLTGLAMPVSARASELNLIPDAAVVATNVALFLLLIFPVNKLLVQPLLRVLDERAARTSGALAESQKLRDDARARRVELETRLAEIRARAQARRTAILGEGEIQERAALDAAREEASGIVDAVRQSVQGELAEARLVLPTDARLLAREVATRVLGRAL